MDNSPMSPYLTPSGEPRTRAVAYECDADRAQMIAEDALEYGNVPVAVTHYRNAARSYTRAAELRAEAAAMPGGTELDRAFAGYFRADAERCNATADRLLYGDTSGAGGGAP